MSYRSAGASGVGTTSGATAVEIAFDLGPRTQYRLTARGASLWFRIVVAGSTGTDAAQVATAGSHFLSVGATFDIAAIGSESVPLQLRKRVSIIRDAATDATGVISEIPFVQAA